MNLIEVYIHEVTRRLPEKNREDIALELRSTIEDMLPDDYSEEDVKAVLAKLGNPAALARGYSDRPMHLIGPRYFDVYVTLLKMVLPIAAVISFISLIAQYLIGYGGNEDAINVVLSLIGQGIGRIIEAGIQTVFWFTLVFAMIERIDKGKGDQPLTTSLKEWTPDDLKNVVYIPKKKAISKFEVCGSLMWTAIWTTIYFYANHLVGVYEGGDRLELVTPALNQEVLLLYWPIILGVAALEAALALYKLIQGQWTTRMAIGNAALQLIITIVFIVIVSNPNVMNQDFISYMTELFSMNAKQFETMIVGGSIFFFILSAAINIFDGFRNARIR